MTCVAYGCKNKSRSQRDLSWFRFPTDEVSRLLQWVQFCGRAQWAPTKSSVLCSEHFEETCFEDDMFARIMGTRRRRHLKPGSVPTIFPFAMPKAVNDAVTTSGHGYDVDSRGRTPSIQRSAQSGRQEDDQLVASMPRAKKLSHRQRCRIARDAKRRQPAVKRPRKIPAATVADIALPTADVMATEPYPVLMLQASPAMDLPLMRAPLPMDLPLMEEPRPMDLPLMVEPRPMDLPLIGEPRTINLPIMGEPRPMNLSLMDESSSQMNLESSFNECGYQPGTSDCPIDVDSPSQQERPRGKKNKNGNGFLAYSIEYRKDIRNQNPDLSFGELSKLVGAMWRGLADSEKKVFEEKARRMQEATQEATRLKKLHTASTQSVKKAIVHRVRKKKKVPTATLR